MLVRAFFKTAVEKRHRFGRVADQIRQIANNSVYSGQVVRIRCVGSFRQWNFEMRNGFALLKPFSSPYVRDAKLHEFTSDRNGS